MKKEAVSGGVVWQVEEEEVSSEWEALGQFSKKPLGKEEVYLFSVRLCDNQVDREEELFKRAALEQLAPLFVGKSGIFDHAWSAKNQTARIYRTEVVPEAGVVAESGEVMAYLKGYAYMLRTEGNKDLIAEIEGGIKKEVSVSCSVARGVCSICGNEIDDESHCGHQKGRVYDGKRCVVSLEDPLDAFEWSFVAVPAQRKAGVIKAFSSSGLQRDSRSAGEEGDREERLKSLEEEAVYGRKYLEALRKDVLCLGLLAQADMGCDVLSGIVWKLEEEELLRLKASYELAVGKRFPLETQLRYQGEEREKENGEDGVFRI